MEAKRQALVALLLLLTGCSRQEAVVEAHARGRILPAQPPLGLPPLPDQARKNVTQEVVELGRRLFFEKRLSADGSIACAECHQPDHGFAEPRKVSLGVKNALGNRNAPSLWNAAYGTAFFWDGRAESLEEQALGPMESAAEMGQPHAAAIAKLRKDPQYATAFDAAFGPGGITRERLLAAIAAYERTLLSGDSPFDRFYVRKEQSSLGSEAQRGWQVFRGKGRCVTCHLVSSEGALFTDGGFHNLGVGLDAEGNLRDVGRFTVTHKETDKGAFKTPSLRNVATTAPYMHDGSLKSLREVVDFYVGGGNANDFLDDRIRPLDLTGQERTDLVKFLESLTGNRN
jgi:cytochrome c peroxidase